MKINVNLYVNECKCSSVAVAQFHLHFLSNQITHNSILLLLLEMHNTLHLPVFSFFSFFSFLCQPYPKYRRIRSKKHFIDHRTAYSIQLFVPIKQKFFGSHFFQNKSQRRETPQALLDKSSHMFISTSLKQTLSSGKKTVYTIKTLILEQTAFGAVLYFGQVFVFCRLINKSVLELFLLIIGKEDRLIRSTNLFSRNHPTFFVFDQEKIGRC